MNFQSFALSTLLITALMSPNSFAGKNQNKLKNPAQREATLKELSELLSPKDAKGFRRLEKKEEKRLLKNSPLKPSERNNWALLDFAENGVMGTSTEKVYREFGSPKKENTVIVAVIDSGVDIRHEDLQGKIWTNTKEEFGKPGVDDDGNGYVDDIYGWSFLGNSKGENVNSTTLEVTREYARLVRLQSTGQLDPSQAEYFKKVSADFKKERGEIEDNLRKLSTIKTALENFRRAGLTDETVKGLDAFPKGDESLEAGRYWVRALFELNFNFARVLRAIGIYQNQLETHYNTKFTSWQDIIGDDPNDLSNPYYGNNDVTGPDAFHGTHVSGIIAATRNNNLGMDGQAENVKIMAIRAVPDGDERDKDIANAIFYAVNNGAKIINMSFGKSYSPHKAYVDSAVAYAQKHGVLLVHAAGNSGKNTEGFENNFPNRQLLDGTEAKNWIEVGASYHQFGISLPAPFSNFGRTSIDLFAPGMEIYSTIPGSTYSNAQGTSMASPEVAGVAALLLSYFPRTSAEKMAATLKSTTQVVSNLIVTQPGKEQKITNIVPFGDLSFTGGIVNTFNAYLKLAEGQN